MLEQGDFAEGQEKEVILGDTKKSVFSFHGNLSGVIPRCSSNSPDGSSVFSDFLGVRGISLYSTISFSPKLKSKPKSKDLRAHKRDT